jgi:hypothetical protein
MLETRAKEGARPGKARHLRSDDRVTQRGRGGHAWVRNASMSHRSLRSRCRSPMRQGQSQLSSGSLVGLCAAPLLAEVLFEPSPVAVGFEGLRGAAWRTDRPERFGQVAIRRAVGA